MTRRTDEQKHDEEDRSRQERLQQHAEAVDTHRSGSLEMIADPPHSDRADRNMGSQRARRHDDHSHLPLIGMACNDGKDATHSQEAGRELGGPGPMASKPSLP